MKCEILFRTEKKQGFMLFPIYDETDAVRLLLCTTGNDVSENISDIVAEARVTEDGKDLDIYLDNDTLFLDKVNQLVKKKGFVIAINKDEFNEVKSYGGFDSSIMQSLFERFSNEFKK